MAGTLAPSPMLMMAEFVLLATPLVVRRTSRVAELVMGKVVPEAGMGAQLTPASVEPSMLKPVEATP